MSADDEMTIDGRFKYRRRMMKWYWHARRREGDHLLEEMEAVTGLQRKGLIGLINGSRERRMWRGQRGYACGRVIDEALGVVEHVQDYETLMFEVIGSCVSPGAGGRGPA